MEKRDKVQCEMSVEGKKLAKKKAKQLRLSLGNYLETLVLKDTHPFPNQGKGEIQNVDYLVEKMINEWKKNLPWYKRWLA